MHHGSELQRGGTREVINHLFLVWGNWTRTRRPEHADDNANYERVSSSRLLAYLTQPGGGLPKTRHGEGGVVLRKKIMDRIKSCVRESGFFW